MTIYIKYLQVP